MTCQASARADQTSVIYLRSAESSSKAAVGQLRRELFRQALLIAARDGMGIQTRDQSLREWRGDPPAKQTLDPLIADLTLSIQLDGPPPQNVWQIKLSRKKWSDDLPATAQALEELSRGNFIDALNKGGWSGQPNADKPGAPAPADAEAQLARMEILSQFAVLRETHEAIRTDGESQQRLGVLVRAYANLGQITRFHWSVANKVFFARSLLYANRMVAAAPNSSIALWHRAYALAMSGLQDAALNDVAAAGTLGNEPAPAWSILLEPYCEYHTDELNSLAAKNPSLAPLATYLAFVTLENSTAGCEAAPIESGQSALQWNPGCLQVVDAMCDRTGPGLLNVLTDLGPQLFSQTLGSQLGQMPGMPAEIAQTIQTLRQAGGNPQGREKVCQALIDQGAADKDQGEPSWSALGRLIQETTVAQTRRRANLIALQWGIDASDYVAEAQPLIADHPYKAIIDAYGSFHRPGAPTLRATLNGISVANLTVTSYPLHRFLQLAESNDSDNAAKVSQAIRQNADRNSLDLERIILSYGKNTNTTYVKGLLTKLRGVDSDAPLLIAIAISDDWDHAKDQAAAWEAQNGDQPTVTLALSEQYIALKQWADAERCLKRYVDVSPDLAGYQRLADIYHAQNQEDRWLSTLQQYLDTAPNYDLKHAEVQVKIANYYMDKSQYDKALPYADAAAQTQAEWALQCAARAHRGVGDTKGAALLTAQDVAHYSRDPYALYAAEVRFGTGDRAAAAEECRSDFASQGDRISNDDLARWATLETIEKNDAQALQIWQRRLVKFPGPLSALHVAILSDATHDSAGRNAALKQIAALPDQTSPLCHFATVLQAAVAAGADTAPDANAIDALLKAAQPDVQIDVYYLTACYLDQHGHKDQATAYLLRCRIGRSKGVDGDLLLAYDALHSRGIDPVGLEVVTTRPAAN